MITSTKHSERSIRKTTWLPLGEVWETLLSVNSNITENLMLKHRIKLLKNGLN